MSSNQRQTRAKAAPEHDPTHEESECGGSGGVVQETSTEPRGVAWETGSLCQRVAGSTSQPIAFGVITSLS